MHWIYFKNKIVRTQDANLSPLDRGYLLGDGVFETLLAKQSHICFFDAHWQRFKNSAEKIYLSIPIQELDIKENIQALLVKNELAQTDAVVRLTLSRGAGTRGLDFSSACEPTFSIMVSPFIKPHFETYTLKISSIRRNEHSPLSNIKSTHYLDNILAYHDARQSGATDALLCNTQGQMTCTTHANLFFVIGNELITAPLSAGALPGITRQAVLQRAAELGIKSNEIALPVSALSEVQEIFITNSLLGVQPVHAVEGHTNFSQIADTRLFKSGDSDSNQTVCSHFRNQIN
jgi:branched-chain amino acid aminotransferase